MCGKGLNNVFCVFSMNHIELLCMHLWNLPEFTCSRQLKSQLQYLKTLDLPRVPAHVIEHAVVLLKEGMRTADKLSNGKGNKQHCP